MPSSIVAKYYVDASLQACNALVVKIWQKFALAKWRALGLKWLSAIKPVWRTLTTCEPAL
jgi:hypothetical protein